MTEENEKGLTFRDKILVEYHKIPFDPELENKDLNEELADILVQNGLLRQILKTDQDKWKIEDIKEAADILSQYGFAYWEFCKVLDAYAQESWKALGEITQKEIGEKYFQNLSLSGDGFHLSYDTHPYRITKNGIEKYFRHETREGEVIEDWFSISITPIILNFIGECLDDESYMYQIKYKTVTGQENIKWVTPEYLQTSSMKDLVNLGLHFLDTDQKDLKQYFKQVLTHSSEIPKAVTAYKNGWKKDNTIFITGSYAHTGNGKKEILALTEELTTAYEVKGNKKQWIETMTPLLEHDLIRLKCYATVTAMLLRFIGVRSFVVHNYYESSGLKSISMQLASSLVGNPMELLKDADSTKVGIERTLEYNTDTPVYFDETSKFQSLF